MDSAMFGLAAAFLVAPLFFVFGSELAQSPTLAIFARWLRWITMALLGAFALHLSGLLPTSFAVLFCVAFLGWFLLESMFFWVQLKAWNQAEQAVFPRYSAAPSGEAWPQDKRFFNLRSKLRQLGYKRREALTAPTAMSDPVRMSVFDSEDGTTRLYVRFLPVGRRRISASFSLHSLSASGLRIVTDNDFLPFGGFFPENWRVERRPWIRSFDGILQRHTKRRSQQDSAFVALEDAPLDEVNRHLHQIEMVNRELGFLNLPDQEEDLGAVSPAGRYRVWQEHWLLSYLGRSLRY